jgi:hypothetical protein
MRAGAEAVLERHELDSAEGCFGDEPRCLVGQLPERQRQRVGRHGKVQPGLVNITTTLYGGPDRVRAGW